ncbi:MAG: hypothetical protein JXA90_15420 [Planctomycetes bacterium]|nr:hypothetical protein [Planctomycetota bacterium]
MKKTSPKSPPDDSAARGGHAVVALKIHRKQLFAVVLLLLVTWVGLILVMLPQTSKGIRYVRALYDSSFRGRYFKCNDGPWGDLEYSIVSLELSEDYLDAFHCKDAPEWFFPGFAESDMNRLAREAGLAGPQRAAFLDTSRWVVEAGGITLKPSEDLVLQLTPDSRAMIYAVLASSPRNTWHRSPLVRRAEMVSQWLDEKLLSPKAISLIKTLSYARGDAVVFSDVELVISRIAGEEEKKTFLAQLFSKPALLLRLRLSAETDIDQVAAYWMHDANATYLKALLKSVAQGGGMQTVDAIHLLPPLPRMLLYSNFPPKYRPAPDQYHCFWTSGNFFNAVADDSLSDLANFARAISIDYYPVSLARKFGDLIVFVRQDQQPVHACNYIADNIVFTKNGRGEGQPWILADLQDVIALYSSVVDFDVQTFRKIQGTSAAGQ